HLNSYLDLRPHYTQFMIYKSFAIAIYRYYLNLCKGSEKQGTYATGNQKAAIQQFSILVRYALCPMPYALCPMPYARL
ncbi:hypothetical protein, partial [Microcoleus sp. AT3-D2]|uniref:hypothetical protein n=1 Tax=Microcoleus sp. AT3-D2 TaxID=2818612 RepID=UPI002FD2497E